MIILLKKTSSGIENRLIFVNEDLAYAFFENKLAAIKLLYPNQKLSDNLVSFYESLKSLNFYEPDFKRISVSKNALYSYLLKFTLKKWGEMCFDQMTQEGFSLKGYAFLVYGSVVRNTAPHNRSDIDVLMVCDHTLYNMDTLDTFNNRLFKFMKKLKLHIDFVHQTKSMGRKKLEIELNSLGIDTRDRFIQSLIDSKILIHDNSPEKGQVDQYRFNETYENLPQMIEHLPKELKENKKFLSAFSYLWNQNRVKTELRLFSECDEDYLDFLNIEISVPILIESQVLVDQNSSFGSWKNTVFKNYLSQDKKYLVQKLLESSDISFKDHTNFNLFQTYAVNKSKASAWHQELLSLSKYSKGIDKAYIKRAVLEGAYPEFLSIFEEEYGIFTDSNAKTLITQVLDQELEKMEDVLDPAIIIKNIGIWLLSLVEYFLYRNGHLHSKIILDAFDATPAEHQANLSYDLFKTNFDLSLKKNSSTLTQNLLKNDQEAKQAFEKQSQFYYQIYSQINASIAQNKPARWNDVKSEFSIKVEAQAHQLFKENGYLIILKENLQRLVDVLEWAAKINFFNKYPLGDIEGVSILFKEKVINEQEYRHLKALKRLTAFLRSNIEIGNSIPINIGTLKNYFKSSPLDDKSDLLFFFGDPHIDINQLSDQAFTEQFKKGLIRTYEIYNKTKNRIYQIP